MTSLLEKYRTSSSEPEQNQEKPSLLSRYRTENPIKSDKIYQQYFAEDKSPEELSNMSIEERMQYSQDLNREREYLQSAGFTKSALSALTLGASEKEGFVKFLMGKRAPPELVSEVASHLKPKEHELNKGFGTFVGEGVKFIPIFKGLEALTGLYKGSKYVRGALGVAGSAGIGGAHATAKQAIKGEGFDPEEIATEAALFGAGDIAIKTLSSIPQGVRWLNSLRPSVRAKIQAEGMIPEGLNQNSYKFFEEEVVPELKAKAESDFKAASQSAEEEAQRVFKTEIEVAKANQENLQRKLDADFQQKSGSYEQKLADYQQAQQDINMKYQQDLANSQAKHEMEMKNLELNNQKAMQEYGQEMFKFDQQQAQNKLVKDALKKQSEESAQNSLQGRVKQTAEDLDISVPAPYKAKSPLHEKIGNIFSDTPVPNSTYGGAKLKNTIQQLDQAAYKKVNDAYEISRQANANINEIHPQLASEIESQLAYLTQIPSPSGPTKNLITTLTDILESISVRDSQGMITGYKPVNNQVLLDQAKELRFKVDHDFAHGTPSGIFKPWIKKIQKSAERAAEFAGDAEAVTANKNAREEYKEWSEMFDNDYVRPYRDMSNKDFSKLYKNAQDRDNFLQIENVLSQTPEGMAEVNSLKRSMVENKLDSILSGKGNSQQFESELKELYPIINKEEAQQIRQTFNESKKTPVIPAKKISSVEKPKQPKFEEVPETVKIPLKPKSKKFSEETPKKQVIEEVKIPHKKISETPSMKAAAKEMDVTPSEAMKLTDSPEGLRKLKNNTSPKIYEKIKGDTIKRILYEGNVKRVFKGDELARVVNKGDNYALLSEMIGEQQTKELLDASIKIGKNKITQDKLMKAGLNASKIKILAGLGIL